MTTGQDVHGLGNRKKGALMAKLTLVAGENSEETVSEPQKGERLGGVRKQAGARPPQTTGDGLTCNEAQVEDLLSEGEST